ncbi:MAG TPA: hypothetical protein VLJ37_09705 [bacterium]|nr:hypothetical protein [bacterium]
MTLFRSTKDVRADFRRQDPSLTATTKITKRDELLAYLSDDFGRDLDDAAVGLGPVLLYVGDLKAHSQDPQKGAWNDVHEVIDPLLSETGRERIRKFEGDLIAADTGGSADGSPDGFVTRSEAVAFVQKNPQRWPNVALFLAKADAYLNRLPDYLAQAPLTSDELGRLSDLMSLYAKELEKGGADRAVWGTLYGLSLQEFPWAPSATDRQRSLELLTMAQNPDGSYDLNRLSEEEASELKGLVPDIILRAAIGPLTPEETAAVHRLLMIPHTGADYDFQNQENPAPLMPAEIGMLDHLLKNANGATFMGMTIVSGEGEEDFLSERNQAVSDFRSEMAAAKGNQGAIERALDRLNRTMARLEADHPGTIAASNLVARAYLGKLTPVELGALRVWMGEQEEAQGLSCDGFLDCLKMKGLQFYQAIARDPVGFLGPLAAPALYHHFFLKNVFAKRLANLCGGGPVENPRELYRQYEKFVKEQSRLGGLKGIPRRVLQNPWVGLGVFMGAQHLLPQGKDSLAIDVALSLAAWESFETYDAFFNPLLQQFAQKNGVCRPTPVETQPAEAPAVETATAADTTQVRALTESDYLEIVNGGAPALDQAAISKLPAELQFLFGEDPLTGKDAQTSEESFYSLIPNTGEPGSKIADLLIQRYAADRPGLAAKIRVDMNQILPVFQESGVISVSRTSSVRWALRQYIQNLEAGGLLRASAYVPLIREGGAVESYYAIRGSQAFHRWAAQTERQNGIYDRPLELGFDEAAKEHWESLDEIAANRAEAAAQARARAARLVIDPAYADLPRELHVVFRDYVYLGGEMAEDDLYALAEAAPRAGELLAAHFAPNDRALQSQIISDVNLLFTVRDPTDIQAANGLKWALREYITGLKTGVPADVASLYEQIATPSGAQSVHFAEMQRQASKQWSEEYELKHASESIPEGYIYNYLTGETYKDPDPDRLQDESAHEWYMQNDPMYRFDRMMIATTGSKVPVFIIIPTPALGWAMGSSAAVESAPAFVPALAGAY